MKAAYGKIRPVLDRLYLAGGVLAAVFLIAILLLITAQMVARWTGQVLTGAPDYTGYAMAASSFLAMAYALNKGVHIRVNLLLNALGRKARWVVEVWCFGIGSYLTAFFAYYAIKSTYESYRWHDISQGQDASPLWVPQLAMCVGITMLAIAFFDNLVGLFVNGHHNISEEALESHAE